MERQMQQIDKEQQQNKIVRDKELERMINEAESKR